LIELDQCSGESRKFTKGDAPMSLGSDWKKRDEPRKAGGVINQEKTKGNEGTKRDFGVRKNTLENKKGKRKRGNDSYPKTNRI